MGLRPSAAPQFRLGLSQARLELATHLSYVLRGDSGTLAHTEVLSPRAMRLARQRNRIPPQEDS